MKTRAKLERNAVQYASQSPVRFYELAGVIVELHDDDTAAFRPLADRLSTSIRRLFYLLEVGRLISKYGIEQADAERVGWTKLQIIARHLSTADDADEADLWRFIDMALHTTAHALPAALKGRRNAKSRAVVFRLNMGARAELNEALLAFGAKQNGRQYAGKERALVKIVRAAMRERE